VDPVVAAAFISVSGTAVVAVAGFGAAIYTGRRNLTSAREHGVWDERSKVYVDAISAVHYRQSRRDYEMRVATLDEKTRQRAEAYLARYKEPDGFELEARLIAFASPEVVAAMQKSSTAHTEALNTFAAEQAAQRAQQARGEQVPDDQVSRLLQSTMSIGARQEADKADDAVIGLIRTDLHGHSQPHRLGTVPRLSRQGPCMPAPAPRRWLSPRQWSLVQIIPT
jgi:hypothetical protein